MTQVEEQILNLASDKEVTKRTVREMQKVVIMESKTIMRKVISGVA